MQVGLHTSTLTNSGGLSSPSSIRQQGIDRPTPVSVKDISGSEYPASPLIATRPQRYSVQLNDQLTALQQADHYLGSLEQKLLDYRHGSLSGGRRGKESPAVKQQATDIQNLLDKRIKMTGGAVDRQLMPVLTGEAQVAFRSPQLAQILKPDVLPESMLFSVQSGRKTILSAVSVTDDTDARQYPTAVNNALRRVGVRTQKGAGETMFTTSESQWTQLANSFSVLGGGGKFSASQKTLLQVQAEPSQSEKLSTALSAGGWGAAQGAVQETLNHLAEQREQLAAQQEKARQLVDGMARFPETQSAVNASAKLSTSLDQASHNYDVLAQAINGQANLSKLTVRSLLS
ncbi:flagellar hook-associated protein [Enterobacteriaceae bacterium RIT711]|nr:flagellar hook-associated protein [Enterobacteriaceae bacterium RIT711]